MKKISRKYIFVATLFVSIFGIAIATQAAGFMDDFNQQLGSAAGSKGAGLESAPDPRQLVAYYIRILLGFLGIGFLVMTVYAGFKILTSQGESDKIEEGKNTLRNSIIGLMVILGAYSITTLAVRLVTGDEARQGNYIEIRDDQNINPDPGNAGISPNAFSPVR